MLKYMKTMGLEAVEASYPTYIITGSVTSIDPLEVSVDPQRDPLTEDFLLLPESLTHYEIDLKHLHTYLDASSSGDALRNTGEALLKPIVIRRGLEVGDTVLLLRVQGGQQFIVLDRVVQP